MPSGRLDLLGLQLGKPAVYSWVYQSYRARPEPVRSQVRIPIMANECCFHDNLTQALY